MNPFVYNDGEDRLIRDDGTVSAAFTTPEWRDGLRYLNRLVSEGLLDRESSVQDWNQRELLKFSLIIVASVPVLAIYPFVQKYLVRSVMIGSTRDDGSSCTIELQYEVKAEGIRPGACEFKCRIAVESFGSSDSLLRATEPGRKAPLRKSRGFPRLPQQVSGRVDLP